MNQNNKIHLQKFIANSGFCSRRKAEEVIKSGKVQLATNSDLVGQSGQGGSFKVAKIGDKIDSEKDVIKIDGKIIKVQEKFVYYAINKPVGYTSTVRDKNAKKTVLDLVPKNQRVYPVGRLDKNTQGLMILTNDGDLTNKLTHPSFKHQKIYQIKCKNIKSNPRLALAKLKRGVKLSEGYAVFDKLDVIKFDKDNHIIIMNVVLHQGWKRQIRRMCERVGLSVLNLKRTQIANLKLGDLGKGKYKIIKKEEII